MIGTEIPVPDIRVSLYQAQQPLQEMRVTARHLFRLRHITPVIRVGKHRPIGERGHAAHD